VTHQYRSAHNRLAFFAIVLLLGSCVRANAADMKAGVAMVDITPPLGTKMWGNFDRLNGCRRNDRLPLRARVGPRSAMQTPRLC
jgi:hypothetical protein